MSIEIFKNLTEQELKQANEWFAHLREPEQPRLEETLNLLNSTTLYLHDFDDRRGPYPDSTENHVAIIVAGTSVDSNDYEDIDIFALTRVSLERTYYSGRTMPGTAFRILLENACLPEHVYVFDYGENGTVASLGVDAGQNVKDSKGAVVTLSLLYQLNGFNKQRPNETDDLIEPSNPCLDAEDLIKYNRDVRAKFLVLSRQYEL